MKLKTDLRTAATNCNRITQQQADYEIATDTATDYRSIERLNRESIQHLSYATDFEYKQQQTVSATATITNRTVQQQAVTQRTLLIYGSSSEYQSINVRSIEKPIDNSSLLQATINNNRCIGTTTNVVSTQDPQQGTATDFENKQRQIVNRYNTYRPTNERS